MNTEFIELRECELENCSGGGIGTMLLIAGGALVGGFGLGWLGGYVFG